MSYFDHYIIIEYIRCDKTEDYWGREDEYHLRQVSGNPVSEIEKEEMAGPCKRNAPIRTETQRCMWPITYADDWCGDHRL